MSIQSRCMAHMFALLLLPGCVGVPRLVDRPEAGQPDLASRPKVENIAHEIACELMAVKSEHAGDGLFQQSYLVAITLSLQVDDYLNLSPSLSFIHPISLPTTNIGTRALGIAADLDGQRERTFTETYYIYSEKFPSTPPEDCSHMDAKRENPHPEFGGAKLYTLRGNLQLAEIIADGEMSNQWGTKIKPSPVAKGDVVVAAPALVDLTQPAVVTDASKKAIASFGSTVEFIVTKSLDSFGPTWTLTKFKGGGGSNGLINGKLVRTDKLIITFTPNPEPAGGTSAAEATAKAKVDILRATRATLDAKVKADQVKLLLTPEQSSEQQQSLAKIDTQITQADAEYRKAQDDHAKARSPGDANALGAAQQLQTTMILQSLSLQPH